MNQKKPGNSDKPSDKEKRNAGNNLDPMSPNKSASNYKTVKCRHFELNGHCRYGDKCSYAHGDADLRKGGKGKQPQQRGVNMQPVQLKNDAMQASFMNPALVQGQVMLQPNAFNQYSQNGGNMMMDPQVMNQLIMQQQKADGTNAQQ